jgi:hypothetical protein
MKRINLDLSVDDTNLILEGLGNLPFVKVHELIAKLHQQASAQVVDIKSNTQENSEHSDTIVAGQ